MKSQGVRQGEQGLRCTAEAVEEEQQDRRASERQETESPSLQTTLPPLESLLLSSDGKLTVTGLEMQTGRQKGNSRARESPFLDRLSQQSLSSLCWVPVPEEKAYLEQNR